MRSICVLKTKHLSKIKNETIERSDRQKCVRKSQRDSTISRRQSAIKLIASRDIRDIWNINYSLSLARVFFSHISLFLVICMKQKRTCARDSVSIRLCWRWSLLCLFGNFYGYFFSFLGGSADEKKQEIIFIVSIELKERERERLRN